MFEKRTSEQKIAEALYKNPYTEFTLSEISKLSRVSKSQSSNIIIKMEKEEQDSGFWAEGAFFETVSSGEAKGKMRTFHMKHDEEMNYDCAKCGIKISAHNKDGHAGMCDDCFNKKHFRD